MAKNHKEIRAKRKTGYYQAQFERTRANKMRRLLKRMSFDPSAVERLKHYHATW